MEFKENYSGSISTDIKVAEKPDKPTVNSSG